MMSISLKDISISNIHAVYYRDFVNGISKIQGINLLQNVDLRGKGGA